MMSSVGGGVDANEHWDEVERLFNEARCMVSNTADRGYETDASTAGVAPPRSFPAKLAKLLIARHRAGAPPIAIFPCELTPANGDTLRGVVLKVLDGWNVPAPARRWIADDCVWVNSLVDRIVSQPLEPLGAVAEPYALWAIEDRPGLEVPCRHTDIVVTNDLKRYERLKLFILNLGHTLSRGNLARQKCAPSMTVREAMADGRYGPNSTISTRRRCSRSSPASAWRPRRAPISIPSSIRFRNPFLDHRLAEIFTNHEAKKQRRFGGLIELAEANDFAAASRASERRWRLAKAPFRPIGMTPSSREARSGHPELHARREPAGSQQRRKSMKKFLIATALISLAALSAPSYAAEPTIPIIVKDTTSFYWQIVLAGARKAGKDLGVNVPELGAQSESDINGQISILENAVAGKPAAIVISPTQFKALGKPIDEAAKKVKIIGIDLAADFEGLHLVPDHRQCAGRAHRRRWPRRGDQGQIRQGRGRRRAHHLAARRRLARPARQGLQGGARGQISRPQARRRQGRGRPGDDRSQHHDRPDHRQSEPARRLRLEPDHGAGRRARRSPRTRRPTRSKLIGFDTDDKMVGFLKDGTISALVVQDPYRMGYDGIKTALAASKGEKVENFVDTGANLITKANMNGEKQRALLNPKVK